MHPTQRTTSSSARVPSVPGQSPYSPRERGTLDRIPKHLEPHLAAINQMRQMKDHGMSPSSSQLTRMREELLAIGFSREDIARWVNGDHGTTNLHRIAAQMQDRLDANKKNN